MTGSLSMNGNRIYTLPIPTGPQQPVTKTYLESQIASIPQPDLSLYLKVDGSVSMTGDLNMNDNKITDLETQDDVPISDYPNYVKDLKMAVNKLYVNENFLKLKGDDYDLKGKRIINTEPYGVNIFGTNDLVSKAFVQAEISKLPTDVLKLDGSRAMTGSLQMGDHAITGISSSSVDDAALTVGDAKSTYLPLLGDRDMQGNLDMANHSIIRLKDPKSSDSFHASNVNYVNRTITDNNAVINTLIDDKISEAEALNIKANRQDNEFSFVMDDDLFKEDDDDITKVGKIDKDFYQINKATYRFKIKYDSAIGYYSSRLSIDLRPLDLGEYTLAFEMYYNDKVDHDDVIVGAVSETLNVSLNNTNTFSDHSRTIINFHKYGNLGIIDLDIDLTLKYKSGNPYDGETDVYVVVYGVTGHQNEVDPRIWDRFYYIGNKIVHFEAPVDMINHQIKRLAQGTESSDAINVRQLSIASNYLEGKIDKINEKIGTIDDNKNLIDLLINYLTKRLDLNTLKELFFPDSKYVRQADRDVLSTVDDNKGDFTFYYVFRHIANINGQMTIEVFWLGIVPALGFIITKDNIRIYVHDNYDRTFNIPNNMKGGQVFLWLSGKDGNFEFFFSGFSSPIIFKINIDSSKFDNELSRITVNFSPFNGLRGLITKNILHYDSEAFNKVKEYEKSQGTII